MLLGTLIATTPELQLEGIQLSGYWLTYQWFPSTLRQ